MNIQATLDSKFYILDEKTNVKDNGSIVELMYFIKKVYGFIPSPYIQYSSNYCFIRGDGGKLKAFIYKDVIKIQESIDGGDSSTYYYNIIREEDTSKKELDEKTKRETISSIKRFEKNIIALQDDLENADSSIKEFVENESKELLEKYTKTLNYLKSNIIGYLK